MRHSWPILVCSECGEMDTDETVCGFCESSEGVTIVEVAPADHLRGAVDRAEKAERELREFKSGLTDALRAHNVPATPTWAEAIHWLARRGRTS